MKCIGTEYVIVEMIQFYERYDIVRNKQYLKPGIAILIAIGICGGVIYGLMRPKSTLAYGDFSIDSAIAWLENADRGNFDMCRKSAVDHDGWFDWFVKDRKSLGKIKERSLISRQELPGAAVEMKRYELKFNSQFSCVPKNHATERMVVETDGKKQFKILMTDYWLPYNWGNWKEKELNITDETRTRIMTAAGKILKNIEDENPAFFKRSYAELTKKPNYFGWWRFSDYLNEQVLKLFKFRREGKPSAWEFYQMKIFSPLGRTGFESSRVWYHFSVTGKRKTKKFVVIIFMSHDGYQANAPDWEFYGLGFREIK